MVKSRQRVLSFQDIRKDDNIPEKLKETRSKQ
jgi:hypothetical protein